MTVHTVADCINEISRINEVISIYQLCSEKVGNVFVNECDIRVINDLLLNYKDLLMELEVKHIMID